MMKEEGCQAVFVANDNKLASHGNMAILGGACLENGLPLYCAAFKEGESLPPPAFHKKPAIMKRVFFVYSGFIQTLNRTYIQELCLESCYCNCINDFVYVTSP